MVNIALTVDIAQSTNSVMAKDLDVLNAKRTSPLRPIPFSEKVKSLFKSGSSLFTYSQHQKRELAQSS